MFSALLAKHGSARRLAALVSVAIMLALPAVAQNEPEDQDTLAESIVRKADDARFPTPGFEAAVTIESSGTGEPVPTRSYRVLSKGNENTAVMVTEPASERGQIILMKGRDLWVFLPNLSQPVRLALSQRLSGQVSNGDLARANFTGDYKPKVLRTEIVDGEPTYVLQLDAVDRGVTYHKVIYWVRKAGYRPYKAEFYSLSDKLLKTCSYEAFKRLAGAMRPTRLVMRDALRPEEQSVLIYTEMKPRDLPDRIFTKDYLKRLE